MKVFKIKKNAKLPTKSDEDMCYDLYACLDKPKKITHGVVAKIPTGLKIDFGKYHASIRPRSGMASEGIDVLGGQIDKSYRGEIIVMLTSHVPAFFQKQEYYVKNGDKIAQMKLEEDITVEITEVRNEEELSITNRGADGFGSTGK